MIYITRDEFGYYSAQIYNGDITRYLGSTFRYVDKDVCYREAIALERIYTLECSPKAIAERETFIKSGGSND